MIIPINGVNFELGYILLYNSSHMFCITEIYRENRDGVVNRNAPRIGATGQRTFSICL